MEAKVISLRVSPAVAQALERAARARRTSKSRIILESIEGLLKREPQQSSYELGKDLFGRYTLGLGDASTRTRKLFQEYAFAKHARRQRPARRAVRR